MGSLSHALGRAPIRVALYAILAMILVWPVLGDAARFNEFRDSQILMLYERVAVDTVKRFGELPLWNPYYCGGLDGLGAPQSRFASPPFLFSLLFGAERAEIIIVFSMVIVGMEGAYRWLRLRIESAAAAAVVAPIFALSGHFAVAYFRGWTGFFGFELVPWILLGVTLAARGRVKGLFLASVAFAFVLGFGGTFAAPLVAVAALFEGLRTLAELPRSSRTRGLAMLASTAAFMAAVACFRLWPLVETLTAAPRIMAGTPGNIPKLLVDAFIGTLDASRDGDVEIQGSFFVGWVFLALIALGGAERKAIVPILIGVLFLWFAQGYARKPAPFALIRELPVFAALRYPERFLWLAILFGCEPAAHGLAKIPFLGEGRGWRRGAAIVMGLAIAYTLFGQITTFHRVASQRHLGAIDARETPANAFHQSRGNRWLAAHVEARGVGSLSCWETHPVLQSPLLEADRKQEEYLADPRSGKAVRVAWSPNKIIVDVTLVEPGRLLVNQNWDPGWRASSGNVISNEGLLAVDLPAGRHMVTLAFRPWPLVAGAAVSLSAILALGVLGLRARQGRKPFTRGSWAATCVFVLVPWAVAIAAHQMSPQPPWPAPTYRNANGEPAIVENAGDATPIGASFAIPVRVAAARVTEPDANQNVAIDVYLERTGAIPRTMAMFVHLERRGKPAEPLPKDLYDFFNADHQVVGRSFYLSDAPEHALIHDAFSYRMAKALPGTYDVWIGFGHVSGRKGRVGVADPGTAKVDGDRVLGGTFTVR